MLASPGNQHIIRKIKASITAGIRPCAMIFHEQPGNNWEPYDFALIEAYQILQDETCPKCGQPVWLCRSDSKRIEFAVEQTYCYATKALEEKAAKRRKDKVDRETKLGWGRVEYAVPRVPDNEEGDLPTRREFYQEIAKNKVE